MRCRAATPASCWRSVSLRSRAVPVPGKELVAALETARIDSPRGAFTLSKAHNPIQGIYLRKVVGMKNRVVAVAHQALADPARGCKLA